MVVHRGAVDYAWGPTEVTLDGADADDPLQGAAGDCYLIAAMSAVAARRPSFFKEAVRDNGDGTYTVRFYQPRLFGSPKAVDIRVDGELPAGGRLYARSRNYLEAWVGIVEKAYAQWKGGYERIGKGGNPAAATQALLGSNSWGYSWQQLHSDRSAKELLRKSFAAGKAVTVAAPISLRAELRADGIATWHAYSVLGVSDANGRTYVTLRNPWGHTEPGFDGTEDGIFKLELREFRRLFPHVFIA